MSEILATESDLVEATLESTSCSVGHLENTGFPTWQQSLKAAFRSNLKLLKYLELDEPANMPGLEHQYSEQQFSVLVPREYAARMVKGDPNDPLLLQVLASGLESKAESTLEHGMLDPVGDGPAEVLPGLLQKYKRRALLITSGACAVHCRYCFRRHFPYNTAPVGLDGWQPALEHIQQDRSIDEVILSGGDPLTVTDQVLAKLIEKLNSIEHLKRIRLHTRLPVVIPQRVCAELMKWVKSSRCAVYFVLHFNHAREFDSQVELALRQLRLSGASLLNQSVMLRGVNDSFEVMQELCIKLVEHHVLPYYVHQLDLVQGALHFQVDDSQARTIFHRLRANLPGFAVPRLVREVAGESSKSPLD